jgi:hypothetical protein
MKTPLKPDLEVFFYYFKGNYIILLFLKNKKMKKPSTQVFFIYKGMIIFLLCK